MLKKNQPIQFKREGTVMESVYNLIKDGSTSKHAIVQKSKLKLNQVEAALTNLSFVGMIEFVTSKNGNKYYPIGEKPKERIEAQKNSFCISKNKGGRPIKLDKQKPVLFRPKSTAAREAFYRMGGSRWINRILEGLSAK